MRNTEKAHKYTALFIFFLITIFTAPAHAGTWNVFGPQSYVRSVDGPDLVTTSFSIAEPNATYTLVIHNGGLQDGEYELVSSSLFLINGLQVVGPNEFNQNVLVIEKAISLVAGTNSITVELRGKPAGGVTVQIVGIDNEPPIISASVTPNPNFLGWNNTDTTVNFQCADTLSGIESCPPPVTITTDGADQVVTGTAVDQAGNSVTTSATLNVDKTAPALQILFPAVGASLGEPSLQLTGTVSDAVSGLSAVTCNGIPASLSTGSFSCTLTLAQGLNPLKVIATDTAGNIQQTTINVTLQTTGLPPDPSTVAPEIDPTVATTVFAATQFLYSGNNPIQTDVAENTIKPELASVLRGRVMTNQGEPLSGVRITIANHPEFGSTLSRQDGWFDMAVNGGGILTVDYTKSGHLPAQRQADLLWQEYFVLNDVALIEFDPVVTSIDFTDAIQVARGSTVTDEDGTRQGTLLFPQTTATMVLSDGSEQALTSMNVRITEFTVGDIGPAAMPAELPENSMYTYAVDLSVDEAVAAGAKEVRFDPEAPAIFYVDNFLDFPAGTVVPAGYYDRITSKWSASESGRVIKIVSVTQGLADLDINGDEVADNQQAHDTLGVSDLERNQLAILYPVAKSLWRVRVSHFSPWDLNWGPFPEGVSIPNQPSPEQTDPIACPNQVQFSIIECQNQILGEKINIDGTPFSLNYRSDRVTGYGPNYTLQIPLSGSEIPALLQRITLKVSVAGKTFDYSYQPQTSLSHTFVWDGRDVYGRIPQSKQAVRIEIGYVYDVFYSNARRFGWLPDPVSGPLGTARGEVKLVQEHLVQIGGWQSLPALKMGGWTIDVHHSYDPTSRSLFLGNGRRRIRQAFNLIIDTIAGTGNFGSGGDGGPAKEADLTRARGLDVGSDGSVYIADYNSDRVRKVARDRTILNFAGTFGEGGFGGDGGPAIQALLNHPVDVAIAPDGSAYISDSFNLRIRKVDTNGMISTLAGSGNFGYSGDEGPAVSADMTEPGSIAVASDGAVYFADTLNWRIRRIETDGRITTVVGDGQFGYSGDGGSALLSRIGFISDIALGPDDSLYFVDFSHSVVRRVGSDGIITTVAGTGNSGSVGDGGPATQASLEFPLAIAVDLDGSLYISQNDRRIRFVTSDQIIRTFAGVDCCTSSGDNGPVAAAGFARPESLAINQDGLYIGDQGRVRHVAQALPGFTLAEGVIPSQDGTEIYVFDAYGRHLRTLDALTGVVRYVFGYDEAGLLTSITDIDQNVTQIQRNTQGEAIAVIAPFGQQTTFSYNNDGYLAGVTGNDNTTIQMTYNSGGMLTSITDRKTNVQNFVYDSIGRLMVDQDRAGGTITLTRSEDNDSHSVSLTTLLGRVSTYFVEQLGTGIERRLNTDPAGRQTITEIHPDGKRSTTSPDGGEAEIVDGPDPRFGMLAPIAKSMRITTLGGLSFNLTESVNITLAPGFFGNIAALSQVVTVNGRSYTMTFDAATRNVTETSPLGRQILAVLDNKSRIQTSQVADLAPVSFTYDTNGRLSTLSQGTGLDSRMYLYQYNPEGYLASITDPINRQILFEYDAAGRITRQTLPDRRDVFFGYDANGNLTSLTPPGKPNHSFNYTTVDLTEDYNPPDIGLATDYTHFVYNLDKDLIQVQRPDATIIDLDYDTAGRLSQITISRGPTLFGYHPTTGNLSSITAPDGGILSFTYDGSLLKSSAWTGIVGGTVSHTFDNNFRVASETVNGANSITFGYDNDSLLTSAGGMLLGRDPLNGLLTSTTLNTISDSRLYNTFAEVETYSATAGAVPVYSAQYARDKLGRITGKIETIEGQTDSFAYTYDAAGRLTDVHKNGALLSHYDYDTNSNRLAAGAVYDAQDRLTSYNGFSYSYKANGELQSKSDGAQTTTYVYDSLGNLMSVTLPDSTNVSYIIDGANRRIGKAINGVLVQGFLYRSGLQIVAELNGAGAVVSRFVYATRANVPDYMIKSGVTYRIVSDHLGSPRLVINTAAGAIAQRIDYDEFGNVTLDTNPGFQPFGFAGGLYDQQTKLVRFGARDYDPHTGRWTSKDPILFAGGDTNLYGYVLNDPINFIDPLGLYSFDAFLEDASNYSAGFGDSLTFGATAWIRENLTPAGNIVDKCSGAYTLGEWSEVALELALTGGSGALKSAAKNVSRKAVRKEVARRTARETGLHHIQPLFGHPGNIPTTFPTGGLPSWIHSSRLNLQKVASKAEHLAAHRRLRGLEEGYGLVVNPLTTGSRAILNGLRGCGCD